MAKEKVPVSERALVARLNRRLARDGEVVRKNRSRQDWELGEYYLLDIAHNSIPAKNIDIEVLGRELGCLRAREKLAD
jgi:hypothetical protein